MPKNVLTDFSWGAKHYLKHPLKFLKELGHNLKYGWQRMTRGYADCDWWDMDQWIIHVFPFMLRDIANKGYAYPGGEPFETPEKWKEWLNNTADDIEKLSEEYCESQNEYHNEWMDSIYSHERDSEIRKKYVARFEELTNESQERAKKVFSEIGEHFYSLWD